MDNHLIMATALKLGTKNIGQIGVNGLFNGKTYNNASSMPWSRPAEWMTLPAAPTQGVKALIGISNDDSNYVAVTCTTSAGNYIVDWGDGSTTTVASGVAAEHWYDYTAITNSATSSTTLTVDGHRQCIVTITPVTANLTGVNFNVKHSKAGLIAGMCVNWLDVNIDGAYITSVTFGGSTINVACGYLERCYMGSNVLLTSCSYMFSNCFSLQYVNLFDTSNVSDFSNMFYTCRSITSIPLYDMSYGQYYVVSKSPTTITVSKTIGGAAITKTSAITSGTLRKLSGNSIVGGSITGPNNSTAINTSVDSGLVVGDRVRFSALVGGSGFVIGTINMLVFAYNCYSLQSVPLWNLSSVTNMTTTFQNCYSLQAVPLWNLSAVVNMTSSFQNCYSLQAVPLWNLSAVVNMTSSFQNCYSLQAVPLWNLASVTTMTFAFQNCTSLITVPLWNLSNVSDMGYCFMGCYNLQSVPLWNLSKLIIIYEAFNLCASLKTVPLWDLSSCSGLGTVFAACGALKSVPAFNLASTTDMSAWFQSCYSLQAIPALDFSYNPLKNKAPSSLSGWTVGTGWTTGTLTKAADGTGTATPTATTYIAATRSCTVTIVVDSMSGSTATYTLGGTAGSTLSGAGTYVDHITTSTTAKLIITPVATGLRCVISSVIIEPDLVTTNMCSSLMSLAKSDIVGIRKGHSYASCKLSRAAIVNIFNNLGQASIAYPNTNYEVINISGNYGAADLTAEDRLLATNKGWAITG